MSLGQRISPLQLFVICFVTAFGVSMTTLPRSVAEAAQEDMWLSVMLGGVLFLLTVWTAAKLAAYFPQATCFEYHRILLGPFLGQLFNLILVVLLAMIPIVSIRTFGSAAQMYLFHITPPPVITFSILLLLLYAAQYGLFPVIRLQQVIFVSSHIVFFLIILLGFLAVHSRHYQPFLAEGLGPVFKGAIPSWYAYTGPEFVIGLLYPFITRQKEVFKWSAAAVAALIFVYTLITVIVQGILGVKETAYMLSPTIIAYRSVEIPDTFIERIDGYFLIFWIPVFVACMLNWVYFTAFGIRRMLNLEDSRPVVVLLVPLLLYFVDLPPNYQTAAKVSEWVNRALLVWGLGVLPFLLGLAWWRQRRKTC
ncbi:spore germination gerab [Lucifera butyrica]|uniref:Spore germination gerab n=1 Tax=Lucifera butyrica TaxID=1351585 RepID=A0A498R7Z7_9FIRM|nr:GerAB/ArcD/ProY family transporter [Lucifera butyrica]VBB07309.1 spore germination gerab [Lucifera butyrica]